ncbi:hypothetical protein RFI_02441 [Reticulomyxa filosa]|uniref:Reverse transcriptase domain-containing protein n=1 Tax=Reticulomyxa filosa TaxID=46433 RepID=X6P958_RETFI|nr:hypothetical protein RFI_02441 [Reticulomyxa filosa]|eukprot:ETO34648.1 hypothetical protein RFI_02441 [Reticulomyxa filosa]
MPLSATPFIQPLINIENKKSTKPTQLLSKRYITNKDEQYSIIFLNMRGGLEAKIQRNAAFMNFYNNHFKDILGCCELKTKTMDSYTLLPRAKTIFKPGYYKVMEKNNHNWICNGMSVTISDTHNQNTIVCPLSTDNLMIVLMNKEKIAVIFAYVPPYQHYYESRIDNIYKDIGERIELLDNIGYRILIMGDFNGRTECTGDLLTNDNGKRLLSLCEAYSLKILNIKYAYKKYTYYRILSDKKIGTILDYALVKENEFWDNSDINLSMSVIDEYVESDHLPIKVTFSIPKKHVDDHTTSNNYQLGRFYISKDKDILQKVAIQFAEQCKQVKLYDLICEIDNNTQYSNIDKTAKIYDTFMYWLYETIFDCNAYTYRVTRANGNHHCNLPTNLNNILQAINTSLQDIKNIDQTRFNSLIQKYNELKKEHIQQQVCIALNKIQNAFRNDNDKHVYELLSKLDEKPCHPLHDVKGVPIHTEEGKCRLLTDHYKTLLQKHDDIPEEQQALNLSRLAQYEEQARKEDDTTWNAAFGEDEVYNTVKSMKNNKAVFLDCIPNELWKNLAEHNLRILTLLINTISIKYQQLPSKLLLSKMTSLPKMKIPYDCNSMRGIRIKSSCVSIIDKLILTRCATTIEKQIYPEQGGFREGRSTEDQIISLRIILAYQKYINKREAFICTIDLQKAFDNVWIPGLLTKLYESGIKGKTFCLIKHILEESKVIVESNGLCSNEIAIGRGTGQGFATSATFFNIYINDLIEQIRQINNPMTVHGIPISCLLYADDILFVGHSKDDINMKIQRIRDYCRQCGIKINKNKCTLSVMNKDKQTDIDNVEISNVVDKIKYLGMLIDLKKLCWKEHVAAICEKVNVITQKSVERSIIGGVLSIDLQLRYYTQMIRPMIEYGARVTKLNKTLTNKLEILQHRILTKITHTHYSAKRSALRLLLGIPPIEARYDFLLLSGYYTFIKDKKDLIVGQLVGKEHEHINAKLDQINQETNQGITNTYNSDVWIALNKYQLQQFWNPDYLPENLFTWKHILRTQIYDYHFQKDKNDIRNNDHMQICIDIVDTFQEPHEIYPKIYKKLLDKEEQNGYLFKIITNNINICWKRTSAQGRRLIIESCKWCEESWEKPVHHVLLECIETQKIFDSTRSSDDERESPLICNGKLTITELKRRCNILQKIFI